MAIARHTEKSKITAVATELYFGGTIFWWLSESASMRKFCLQSCNFRFFRNAIITIYIVLNHFTKVFRKATILNIMCDELAFSGKLLINYH